MTSDERLELIRQIPIHGQDIADEFERLQELLSVFRAWKSEIENGNSEDNRWCLASAHNWMLEAKRLRDFAERLWEHDRDLAQQTAECDDDEYAAWAKRLIDDAVSLGIDAAREGK